MKIYRPPMVRRWALAAKALRGLSRLIDYWPLYLVLWALFAPFGPHIRIQENQGPRHTRDYWTQCSYWGPRGTVRIGNHGPCPLIKIIDRRAR